MNTLCRTDTNHSGNRDDADDHEPTVFRFYCVDTVKCYNDVNHDISVYCMDYLSFSVVLTAL